MALHGTDACTNPSFTCIGNYRSAATMEGLVGVAFGRTLLFAKGGAAHLWADADVDPTYPGYSTSVWGYTIGLGAEYAVTDTISVRADYAFMDFGVVTAPAGTLASSAQTLDPVAHLFKVGANYNF
jgi:outer membrane immunogenic protein